jgi:hypothetical protein
VSVSMCETCDIRIIAQVSNTLTKIQPLSYLSNFLTSAFMASQRMVDNKIEDRTSKHWNILNELIKAYSVMQKA